MRNFGVSESHLGHTHHLRSTLSETEVEKILNTLKGKEETPEVKIDLSPGDGVKIKEGPFENFDGVVDETFPTKGTVRVIVTIFGRATPVDLEYWQVEKI